jgi:hypothetical protein
MQSNILKFPTKTLEQYFAQSDTPAADSPVGVAMQRLLRKNPRLTFDEAREQAGGLSADDAANLSSTPSVWTDAEESAIAHIVATETEHDAPCSRMEAIRRMRRRGLSRAVRKAS